MCLCLLFYLLQSLHLEQYQSVDIEVSKCFDVVDWASGTASSL